MKQIITFLFIILLASKAEAKKMVYPIEIVAGMAELIVVGEINSVKGNTYIFDIGETLKGKQYKSITVKMFEEWTCDTRFAEPKKGQKLCLFLKRGMTNWQIINGSTGELLISNNAITLGDEEYKHVDYKYTPYRISVEEFKIGLREFGKCYRFVGEYDFRDEKAHFEQIGDEKQISKLKNTNKFSAWLYKKMIKYSAVKV